MRTIGAIFLTATMLTGALAAETAGPPPTHAVPAGTRPAPAVNVAGVDPLAPTYDHTIAIHNKRTGDRAAILFNKDNTYVYKGLRNGKRDIHDGIWLIKDGGKAVCLTPKPSKKKPFLVINCVPLSERQVGDRWTVKDGAGVEYDVAFMAGR